MGYIIAVIIISIVFSFALIYLRKKKSTAKLTKKSSSYKMPKIRELNITDRELLTGLIEKIMESTDDDSLSRLISSKKAEAKAQSKDEEEEMGKFVTKLVTEAIKQGIGKFDQYIVPWFQDLLGVTPEEYKKLPMNIELQIIGHIMKDPNAGGFFMQYWQVVKKTKWFREVSRKASEVFVPIFDSVEERVKSSITEK